MQNFETIQEKLIYKQYKTTVGDNIVRVSRKLYTSDDEKYKKALRTINKRVDWSNLRIGEILLYVSKDIADSIDW